MSQSIIIIINIIIITIIITITLQTANLNWEIFMPKAEGPSREDSQVRK